MLHKQVQQLRLIMEGLQLRSKERQWLKNETYGELDDSKLGALLLLVLLVLLLVLVLVLLLLLLLLLLVLLLLLLLPPSSLSGS